MSSGLSVGDGSASGHRVLHLDGVLDATTYREVRDCVVKAALDEPFSVIVNVNALHVPVLSAWSVFTSAQWLVGQWPNVPVRLVCADPAVRQILGRNGVTRYVAVFATVVDAVAAQESTRLRRRARLCLPADEASIRSAQEFVAVSLHRWQRAELIATATVVVTELVDNVLRHTDSLPRLRLEAADRTVTVAVEDDSTDSAGRRESAGSAMSGLRIVDSVSRVWGNTPIRNGKVVWAVLDAKHRI